MRSALAELSPDEKRAIETAFFSGLTYVEAAAQLNEPVGTVKTRIRSGLAKLRRALAGKVSVLVRLSPGAAYPPHTHAGEELYPLDGELWIDSRKVYPGEYHRSEAHSSDYHVWSETGCTCVPLTSTEDILR